MIVNDEAGNFLGVLNDGDIIRAISKNEKLKTSINQFLNKTPITITKDDFDNNDFFKNWKSGVLTDLAKRNLDLGFAQFWINKNA